MYEPVMCACMQASHLAMMRHSKECVVALLDTGFPCSMRIARGWSAMYGAVEVCVVG